MTDERLKEIKAEFEKRGREKFFNLSVDMELELIAEVERLRRVEKLLDSHMLIPMPLVKVI